MAKKDKKDMGYFDSKKVKKEIDKNSDSTEDVGDLASTLISDQDNSKSKKCAACSQDDDGNISPNTTDSDENNDDDDSDEFLDDDADADVVINMSFDSPEEFIDFVKKNGIMTPGTPLATGAASALAAGSGAVTLRNKLKNLKNKDDDNQDSED